MSRKTLASARKPVLGLIAIVLLGSGAVQAQPRPDLLAKVDPFVGVDGGGVTGGNTVPGAGEASAFAWPGSS
jgi:putative alpha-1,2-mannosidase